MEAGHGCWKLAVNEFVNTKACQVIQFITDLTRTMHGSTLQKFICKSIGVPEKKCKHSWAKIGDKEYRDSIQTKRKELQPCFRKKLNIIAISNIEMIKETNSTTSFL